MSRQLTIAIGGGGASGALTAYHLTRLSTAVRIVIIEPRPQLGLGLAYSTTSIEHLLNVPAGKMSALPDEPNHLMEWLTTNYRPNVTAADFIPRAIFGKYLQSLVAGLHQVEHLHTAVIDCRLEGDQAELSLGSGSQLTADAVSRHGALSKSHASYTPLTGSALQGLAPKTARELLRRVHQSLKSSGEWRAVVDSLRERTNELWLALPPVEQKRFHPHLLRRWETVRHRMALLSPDESNRNWEEKPSSSGKAILK